jgi:hypothetical protein
MAIYRPPKPRWPAAILAAIVGLLIGVFIGWIAFGRAEPDPEEALERVRVALTDAATTLEIVAIEYAESVEGSEVVNEAEYEGALDALARSRARYQEFRSALTMVDQASTEQVDEGYDELGRLMEEPAGPAEVTATSEELASLLEGLVGGSAASGGPGS